MLAGLSTGVRVRTSVETAGELPDTWAQDLEGGEGDDNGFAGLWKKRGERA